MKGVLGGSEEAGRHIGYLTKYLTKDVAKAAGLDEGASERLREHHRRLVDELAITPAPRGVRCGCSTASNPRAPGCAPSPGCARARPTSPNTSASPGAACSCRVSGRARPSPTTPASAAEFVRQLLERAHVRPGYAVDDGPYEWEKTRPWDPDLPSRPALLLAAIAERQRWKADYTAPKC